MTTFTTDYITGLLLPADRHNANAVVVDSLTSVWYAVPCKTTADAVDVHMRVQYVVLHPSLLLGFLKLLARLSESNWVIEDVLRHVVFRNMTDWDRCLRLTQFSFNNAWRERSQQTPVSWSMAELPRPLLTSFSLTMRI